VRRDEDPGDKRAKTITLTDEGRAFTARMEERLMNLRARVLKGVSREDLETTLRVLNAFNASLDATATPPVSVKATAGDDSTSARAPDRSGSKGKA
jgi:MarR family transcriptional regulator for hemolysin